MAPSWPPEVVRLIDGNRVLKALFAGTGKPVMDGQGRSLDRSSSGYDFSLALELARRGIRDPSELATAIACRPDGRGRQKGERYLRYTVEKALARALPPGTSTDGINFTVERFRIYGSDPARYEMTIGGTTFQLRSGDLLTPKKFIRRHLDARKSIPIVPMANDDWIALVNGWLANGEPIDLPPEACDENALRDAIEQAIEDMPVGAEDIDLSHGKAVRLADGRKAFKTAAVRQVLREQYGPVPSGDVCRVLRELAWKSGAIRVEGKSVRVWTRPPDTPTNAREENGDE